MGGEEAAATVARDDQTYLTDAEIERLSGRKNGPAQCRALAAQGWKFVPDGNGKPLILRAYHDERMGLAPKRRRGPRLAGLASA